MFNALPTLNLGTHQTVHILAPRARRVLSSRLMKRAAPTYQSTIVTYSPGWTLIPTHWCRNSCGYCAFVARTGAAGELLPIAAACFEIERARAAGATELLIMSGEGVEQSAAIRASLRREGFNCYLDYLLHIARAALAHDLLPHINVGNLAEDELLALRACVPSLGMMLETVDGSLRGEAAHRHAADKAPERRLETLQAAGRARVPFTTGLLVGIGESWAARAETLEAIAGIQREGGHIQEVIVQPFTPHAGTAMAGWVAPTVEELREVVRLARAVLPPEIVVQIPPNLAPDIMPLIEAGARDLGGISHDGDRINPAERWLNPRRYNQILRAHGYTLAPRLAVHDAWMTRQWLSPATLAATERVRLRLPYADEITPVAHEAGYLAPPLSTALDVWETHA